LISAAAAPNALQLGSLRPFATQLYHHTLTCDRALLALSKLQLECALLLCRLRLACLCTPLSQQPLWNAMRQRSVLPRNRRKRLRPDLLLPCHWLSACPPLHLLCDTQSSRRAVHPARICSATCSEHGSALFRCLFLACSANFRHCSPSDMQCVDSQCCPNTNVCGSASALTCCCLAACCLWGAEPMALMLRLEWVV
jgi:hypothetical protein